MRSLRTYGAFDLRGNAKNKVERDPARRAEKYLVPVHAPRSQSLSWSGIQPEQRIAYTTRTLATITTAKRNWIS